MAYGRKTGGRQKGTANKPTPLKECLRSVSTEYFTPREQTNADGSARKIEFRDKEGNVTNEIVLADSSGAPLVMSNFDVDMMIMEAKDRAAIHEKLLRYHTPQMQAVSADVSMGGDMGASIAERLKELAEESDG